MTPDEGPAEGGPDTPLDARGERAPGLGEDILLLLFQPASGSIAGENTLYYVLAGAVLAELALDGRVAATSTRFGGVTVEAVEGARPTDELLADAWDYVSRKPRAAQSVLAAIGPPLRQPLLDRLIARGDIVAQKRTSLGLFRRTVLVDGGTGRRQHLLGEVRAVLVDRVEPAPRAATLAALLWASGALPLFGPDIPWTSAVIARAQELEQGTWGAGAASEAVIRTVNAISISAAVVADLVTVQSRGSGPR